VTNYHRLAPALFDRLAAGEGGAAAIEALRSAQLSKHLLLIGRLLRRWPGDAAERDAIAAALHQARRRDPHAFGRVFAAPLVGGWTAIVSRAERRGRASWADLAHLNALAMVACAAAGVDGAADVAMREGAVAVPGLGVAVIPTAGSRVKARLIAESGRLVVRALNAVVVVPADPVEDGPGWQSVRHLVATGAGPQIRLGLDDLDPYRHGHHAPPASRLPAAEFDLWRELFSVAWQLLAERMPGRAAELGAGLRTLVPLTQQDERAARSATIRHAFGVFGLTRPPSAADFAVTLVHEFQHSKLSAMLDLTPMTDPADRRRYFAPWRTDPRPLAGLLQGVYAFVGVADTWLALRDVDGVGPVAEMRFAEARLQVDRGLAAIEGSGALTASGVAVAAGLRRATDRLLAEPVSAATARAAERAIEQALRRWWERHGGAG